MEIIEKIHDEGQLSEWVSYVFYEEKVDEHGQTIKTLLGDYSQPDIENFRNLSVEQRAQSQKSAEIADLLEEKYNR